MKKGVLLEFLISIGLLLCLIHLISGYINVKADDKDLGQDMVIGTNTLEQSDKKNDSNDVLNKKSEEDETENIKEESNSTFEQMIEKNQEDSRNDDGDEDGAGEEGSAVGKGKYVHPSHRPLKSMGMIVKAGFFVQPLKNYYVKQDKKIVIKSKFKESIWNRLSGVLILKDPIPNYRWRYSEDMTHWLRFKKSIAHSKNYEFKEKKVGTYYMQARATSGVLLGLGAIYYYSEIATIHVVKEPKNITDLKVETDEDYLFNMKGLDNITNAREIITPEDAAGHVVWSGDNKTLARIDPISGEVEANQNGVSGDYTITGTFLNDDGTKMSAQKTIEVGGGLDDETVNVDEDATFDLKGIDKHTLPEDWHAEWYEKKRGRDVKLATDPHQLSYTIKNTKLEDHKREFYVRVYVRTKIVEEDGSEKSKEHKFETRVATLNVLNPNVPYINFEVGIENLSFKDENHKYNIDKVKKGDRIKITTVMNNENILSVLKYGVFELPLQSNMKEKHIEKVSLDGKDLGSRSYSVENDDGCPHLRVENLNFIVTGKGEGLTHTIEVEFNARTPDDSMSFKTIPRIHGNSDFESSDSSDKAHNYTEHSKNNLTMNYTNDKLDIKPNTISFGRVSTMNQGDILNRTSFNDKSESVVTIDDQRRDNKKHSLYVRQITPFQINDSSNTLPVSLRYYNEDGSFTILTDSNAPIPNEDIEENGMSDMDCVVWGRDCGLLMHVDEVSSAVGTYHATLEWTAKDAI
ncbi:hypothetical protein [Companilactobacillus keshanensis]|uniref:Ig-like domain-containing protein n=1 Tax=Companilactobacillus keshanensis TaxID=2486003 RepID=A0ABW4BT37_9LACO|nr:hypothetical protein [Companilactobacillus keshanensis]